MIITLLLTGCGSSSSTNDSSSTPDTTTAPTPDIQESAKKPPSVPKV